MPSAHSTEALRPPVRVTTVGCEDERGHVGKEREPQIWGTTLGMAALALLAAVTAIVIAVTVNGHLRSAFSDSPAHGAGTPIGTLEQRAAQ